MWLPYEKASMTHKHAYDALKRCLGRQHLKVWNRAVLTCKSYISYQNAKTNLSLRKPPVSRKANMSLWSVHCIVSINFTWICVYNVQLRKSQMKEATIFLSSFWNREDNIFLSGFYPSALKCFVKTVELIRQASDFS